MLVLSVITVLSVNLTFSQDQLNEDIPTTDIELENPPSVVENYVYDPVSDRYFFNQTVGNFNINYPIILSPYRSLFLPKFTPWVFPKVCPP